jgi:hypothetical protein
MVSRIELVPDNWYGRTETNRKNYCAMSLNGTTRLLLRLFFSRYLLLMQAVWLGKLT